MTEADVGLVRLLDGGLLLALLQFELVEPRAQHLPGLRTIAMLRAVVLTIDHDVGRDVGQPDRRLGLVDVLAARPARPQHVDADVRFLDLHVDAVVDRRIDIHAGERGVPARVGVERRDAHQAMHAALGLEPAIGVAALDLDGGRLDARLFAAGLLDPVDLEAVLLGPARVHSQQHAGPVLALGAAGAGMHLQVAVIGVRLARQERLELAARDIGAQLLERGLGLANDLLVVLGLAELDHGELVVELALDAGD